MVKCNNKANQRVNQSTKCFVYVVIICREDGFGDNKLIWVKIMIYQIYLKSPINSKV